MKYLSIILLLATLSGCASAPRFTSVEQIEKDVKTDIKKPEEVTVYSNITEEKILETEIGIASYYAERFHGRKTANGEIYNMYDLTAAHPTFPLGTIARVTNLKNGKSVLIKINDRMPKHPNRIIDLSYGTAKELDMVKDGLAKVRIDILKWGDDKYFSPSDSTSN